MRDLKLVSLSEDGSHLVLTHEGTGEQFALAIDDRIRSAVVSDRARVGQLPLEVESRLRPKEIQARVRSGEASEDIAAAAGVSLERVLRYAGPVLAEREHIAALARRCAVRRHGHEGPGAILHQMVESRLRGGGFSTDTLAWDAWRGSGSSWTVAAQYAAAGDTRTAMFDFDPVSRIVIPADDRARVLTGEQSVETVPPEFEQHDPVRAKRTDRASDRERTGQRARLSAVPNPDAVPSADIRPRHEEPSGASGDGEDTVDLTGIRRRAYPLDQSDSTLPHLGPDEVAELDHPDEPTEPGEPVAPDATETRAAASRSAADESTATAAGSGSSEQAAEQAAGPARRPHSQRKRRSKRAVVPSWDEILFGAADSNAE